MADKPKKKPAPEAWAPGLLPGGGGLNVVEDGSPRVPLTVVDNDGNEIDPNAEDGVYDEDFADLLEDEEAEGDE